VKKLIAFLLAVILLLGAAGCRTVPEEVQEPPTEPITQNTMPEEPTEPAEPQEVPDPKEGQFVFTRENFPRLDGSTSTVPLAQAMAAMLLNEPQEQVADIVTFSRTTNSYRALINPSGYYGYAELLLAAEPAELIWEEKATAGFEWDMEPFAIDGLIFVVNADNPVDSLSVEQVQKIYTGEITNWSEVGGNDVEIIPFQRNEEAGSQTMMEKLVMGDLVMTDPPKEYRIETMSGLMETVRNYQDSAGAIGYSVYYYANDMRMAEGLKVLQINGVTPGADSFRDQSYPFTNPYYVVKAAELSEDDPITILFNWILGEEGKKLVERMGYVPIHGLEDAPSEDVPEPQVYANWSMLEDPNTPEEVYTSYWPELQQELIAHDDYGLLVPFAGDETDWMHSNYQKYVYGLATLDGKVVVEPTYESAVRMFWGEEYLPVLRLRRFVFDEEIIADAQQKEEGIYEALRDHTKFLYGLAAADGSWYLPTEYAHAEELASDTILLVDQNGTFFLCDLEGNLKRSPIGTTAGGLWGDEWRVILRNRDYVSTNGWFVRTINEEDYENPESLWTNFLTGEKTITPGQAWDYYGWKDPETDSDTDASSTSHTRLEWRILDDGREGVIDSASGRWVMMPQHADLYTIRDVASDEEYIEVREGDYRLIYNVYGEFLFGAEWYGEPVDGVFPVRNGQWSGLRDKEGNWLLRFIIPSNTD